MKSQFVEKEICYTGPQLSPHWIYKNFHIKGDAILSFIGECDVKIEEMVDIEDVIENSPIYSKKMLHFIVEHFNIPMVEGVLRQRLLINIARDAILSYLPVGATIKREGDDLYFESGKLSVSIATKSVTSILIHFALNIDADGAPVRAAGLKSEMKLENIRQIADDIINNYCAEHEEIYLASCKVRGVY